MGTRRRVRVIQHVAGEGPGLIEVALEQEGIALEITRVDLGDRVPEGLGEAGGLVVLGGPMGVYEADRYPHLHDELRLVAAAVRAGAPVLGVCLGSQIVAAALGARVARAPAREIGWLPVTRSEAGATDALFGPLPASFTALHWHGDVFDLPRGATSLASSAMTRHQAFRHDDRTYGFLFHLEQTAQQVEGMARSFAGELAEAGVSAGELLDETGRRLGPAAEIAVPLFRRWAALLPGP